ncbi:zona pellucida sperm-binding protein 3-like [Pseudonaja textilis]|uniref:zona pellucida sperm-binding protein 3-like n=1 Tax=Pseudonaja textilis TaxID=8673 RepID=UPI000EAA8C0C|nr:zona pellucida sperm-binding protein 3-like [Pseudonaja textilis]
METINHKLVGRRPGDPSTLSQSTLIFPTVPENSVIYKCNRTRVHLAVKMDPWGTGVRLDPEFLYLGSCPSSHVNDALAFFHFQYSFKECRFARLTSGLMVEYTTHLVYRPVSSHDSPFTERINCTTYETQRLTPARVTGSGLLSASSGLTFRGTFMNEDFSGPSDLSVFLLGSQIHIEFAVQQFFHQPLRLFVDECIAADTAELGSSFRNYTVIANQGCLLDSKFANSRFLPRHAPDVLRLSLQAFEFAGINTDVYLHCQVLVWEPAIVTNPTKKACSFKRDTNRWEVLDGTANEVCRCCDSVCETAGSRHKREVKDPASGVDPLQSDWLVVGRLTVRRSAPSGGDSERRSNHGPPH